MGGQEWLLGNIFNIIISEKQWLMVSREARYFGRLMVTSKKTVHVGGYVLTRASLFIIVQYL